MEDPIDEETPLDTTQILPRNNDQIDKLTMELLLNKNHYSKYLQHTDTKRFDEFKAFKSKLRKHSVDIIDITSELVENPRKTINKDIEESFEIYVKSIIRYLEIKESNKETSFQKEEDEDVLFGNMEEPSIEEVEPKKSLWGKEKVIKSKKISPADMHLFRPFNK
jgi:vacuolar-type H+-ATPase subunit F/Vma7